MTLTETRPEPETTAAAPPEPVVAAPESWLTTSDHKKIGILFLAFSLLFLLIGGVLALVLRGQLAEGDIVTGANYGRLFSMHATVMTLLFLAPAWVGLATYVVPLQIGSGRLAFPRLHAGALWLYLMGGGLMIASYLMDQPDGLGITVPTPVDASGGPANH